MENGSKENYERLNFEPIQIERIGRIIKIKSNWEENQHKKFMDDIKNKRPKFKKEIDEKIEELLNKDEYKDNLIIANYNSPFQHVISGKKELIEKFTSDIKLINGKSIMM